ncbi:adenosine deaminase [Nonomuraea sp. NPDC050663]|uniref:adenosine deaminase n=1 Tax=Nonomuraea sp. NPDC050663 TaxID=3364370 RepID=UPI0037AE82D3
MLAHAGEPPLPGPDDVYRLMREAAEDEAAEGSRWLEIQVDPSGYASRFGGLTGTLELVLDAAEKAAALAGIGIAVIVAANRTRHPLDARTLARLAAQYADRGVVGFGLSNDERRGQARDFDAAFRIAKRAGLLAVPHGGELQGPRSVEQCVDDLDADRVGHGVRSAESPRLMERLADRQICCEVCPTSNVGLGRQHLTTSAGQHATSRPGLINRDYTPDWTALNIRWRGSAAYLPEDGRLYEPSLWLQWAVIGPGLAGHERDTTLDWCRRQQRHCNEPRRWLATAGAISTQRLVGPTSRTGPRE